MLVFTYGTLRKGYHNHHFLKGQTFIGPDALTGTVTEKWGLPFLNLTGDTKVEGEVYDVTPDRMETIDWLEGIDRGLYKKETVTLHSGQEAVVYVEGTYKRGIV
jgi:gamma-glutamylaminecyclotransferase